MGKRKYHINFRAHFHNGNHTNHRAFLELKDIPKWLEAYHYTHPEVKSITVKYWPNDPEEDTP